MHNISIQRQRGFTLVEIAIVLVIIGLLLGGILKGQELITSARVRNIADQNSGIQAAYFGFIDRYRQIPGDMDLTAATQAIGSQMPPTAANSSTAGNTGNGRIDTGDWAEASNVWAQLSAAQFIQGSYTGGATSAATYMQATMAPINAFNGYVLLGRSDDYQDATGSTTVRLGLVIGAHIPVNVMRELDVKIDDGLPQTGVLRVTKTGSTSYSTVDATNADCITTATPIIWDINTNQQDCNAMYLY